MRAVIPSSGGGSSSSGDGLESLLKLDPPPVVIPLLVVLALELVLVGSGCRRNSVVERPPDFLQRHMAQGYAKKVLDRCRGSEDPGVQ